MIRTSYTYRLNKIGINPNIVASHEKEGEDDDGNGNTTLSAVVNALSEQAEQANTSIESDGSRSVLTEIGRSLHILTASLPRPKSECNFATIAEHQPMLPWSSFHRSDTIPVQPEEVPGTSESTTCDTINWNAIVSKDDGRR